jgi:hypothetical protein
MDDATLRTIWQQKRGRYRPVNLAEPLTILMKKELSRNVRDVGDISEAWDQILPPEIVNHTSLESYNRGVLTVSVSSSSRRFQLQTFLSGGGLQELRDRCRRAINKVKLVPAKG